MPREGNFALFEMQIERIPSASSGLLIGLNELRQHCVVGFYALALNSKRVENGEQFVSSLGVGRSNGFGDAEESNAGEITDLYARQKRRKIWAVGKGVDAAG